MMIDIYLGLSKNKAIHHIRNPEMVLVPRGIFEVSFCNYSIVAICLTIPVGGSDRVKK